MRVLNQTTSLEPLTAVKPHPRNPRRGDVDAVQASIDRNGFYGAIVAQQSTRHILAGNHRYLAAQAAGATEIPVIWIDVDDDHALRILLADNRTSDLADYDDETLTDLLRSIQAETGTLAGTGYTGDDLNRLLKTTDPLEEDDTEDAEAKLAQADALQAKWQVAPGDAWTIPSRSSPHIHHTIVCGDSTTPETLEHAGITTLADMVFTDPPYGVAYVGKTADALTIENDALEQTSLHALIKHAATAWPLRPGGAYYVCAPPGPLESTFRQALEDANHPVRQGLVWVKNTIVLGHSDYHYRHEPVIYGWRPGGPRFFTRDRTQASVHMPPPNLKELDAPELRDLIRELRRELKTSVWLEDKPPRSPLHPTTKPIHLPARAIRNSSMPGQTVFDGFNGSGTTGLAADLLGRNYVGVELDPKYVAVTLERFASRGMQPRRATS